MIQIQPLTLQGGPVRLEPLSLDHLEPLCQVGLDPDLWHWTTTRLLNKAEMAEYICEALAGFKAGTTLPFATRHVPSGQVVGSTRFGNIDPCHHRAEIGWTWIAPAWQRTAVNTTAKYLMLCHAFETWKCLRVELKTDVLNDRSRLAILRIGAKEEGVFRKHMIMPGGRVRDTVYYSILDTEWASVKAKLEAMLRRDQSPGAALPEKS